MSFVWPLYPFTATSPTWATTTGLNALATVHSRPSRTRLTNSPASSITSLPLVSLMTKPSLPSLKLATRNADSVNCNPSHGKWVTQSWRQPCDLQFLERRDETEVQRSDSEGGGPPPEPRDRERLECRAGGTPSHF